MGGDSPVEVLVECLQERSRLKMVKELRRFITVDNREAVSICHWARLLVSLPVVEPKLDKEDFPETAVREGAEELTLRKGEERGLRTVIDTTNVGGSRWRPLSVDGDWHAICQTNHKVVEGEEWESLYQKFVEMHKAVNIRTPSNNHKAKTLWMLREARASREADCDRS